MKNVLLTPVTPLLEKTTWSFQENSLSPGYVSETLILLSPAAGKRIVSRRKSPTLHSCIQGRLRVAPHGPLVLPLTVYDQAHVQLLGSLTMPDIWGA